MDLDALQSFLGWCTALNFGLLTVWFILFTVVHDWIYEIHGRWFDLTPHQFDSIHYGAIAGYKLLIFIFNLMPYIALQLI